MAANPKVRNWLDLPSDAISVIFLKLGAINIISSAQSVCSTWRNLAKDPFLYRSIDLRNHREFDNNHNLKTLATEAINRSRGQLVEFSIESFATDELLHHMASGNSNSLRSLRLVYCSQLSNSGLIEAVKKLPLLEQLELCHCSFSKEAIEEVGRLCSQLRCFRLDSEGILGYESDENGFGFLQYDNDVEAFAIAENMPQLRNLQLFGNKLTNDGLEAILDGCPYLEYLDLRRCFDVNLSGDLMKKCGERIKYLRHTHDSTHDYEYQETIKHNFSESDESDYDYDYDFE